MSRNKMQIQNPEPEKKQIIKEIVKKLGVMKTSRIVNKQSEFFFSPTQQIVSDNLFTLSLEKGDKLEKIKEDIKNLDSYKIYDKKLDNLIREKIEQNKEEDIKEESNKLYQECQTLKTKQFYANYTTAFELQSFLKEELKNNPQKFKITITYNPTIKENI